MNFFALGINHRSAPLEVRERVAFAPEKMIEALQQACHELAIEEAAILSTCNRTEIYAAGEVSDTSLLDWLVKYHRLDAAHIGDCYYHHSGEAAVRHVMKVASGLDSMVLGEPQILGQFKSAYAVAREAGTAQTVLNHVFQQCLIIAKRVRTETAIGQNPVSVAYAAVSLAQQIFSDLREVNALLIGAGETIELVARHMREKNIGSLTVANRTLSRAEELADKFGAEAILLSDIHDRLNESDVVITSTASQLPILGKGAVESALKIRKHKPIFMVDIAVPRDIEPEVETLADVYLYTVDDLKEVIDENVRNRQEAAQKAEKIVDEGVEAWRRQCRVQDVVGTIRTYRSTMEAIRDAEVEKALNALGKGEDPAKVLKSLARSLTNKLLHTPTANIKRAGEEGRSEHIDWAHQLLGLDRTKDKKQ